MFQCFLIYRFLKFNCLFKWKYILDIYILDISKGSARKKKKRYFKGVRGKKGKAGKWPTFSITSWGVIHVHSPNSGFSDPSPLRLISSSFPVSLNKNLRICTTFPQVTYTRISPVSKASLLDYFEL